MCVCVCMHGMNMCGLGLSNCLDYKLLTCNQQERRLYWFSVQFSSVAKSCLTLCNPTDCSTLPCPSPTPRVYSNSCPSGHWCHPTISSSVVPFSSCLQYFPASGSFPMSQFFASGGQSNGVSTSASVPPINIQDWFPLGWESIHWIGSPCSPRDSQESSLTPQFKSINSSALSFLKIAQFSHPYMTTGKTIGLTRQTFFGKVIYLL